MGDPQGHTDVSTISLPKKKPRCLAKHLEREQVQHELQGAVQGQRDCRWLGHC